MKPSIGAVVALLAAYSAANTIRRNDETSALSDETATMGNDTSTQARFRWPAEPNFPSSGFVRQKIHGSPAHLRQFVESLTLSDLKQILGDGWGQPFRIELLDKRSGRELGYIQGYFTSSGGVEWDSGSRVPAGGSLPVLQADDKLGPLPIATVTLTGAQSARIIAAGKVTDANLREFLGRNYGKPFKLILTGNGSGNIGVVSGYFSGSGPKFDADSKIPSAAANTITLTLNAAQSQGIIKAGKVTDQDLRNFLGSDYPNPFKLILTDGTGNRVGFVLGSFSGGSLQISPDSIIPSAARTITLTGAQSQSVISAGKVTDQDLRNFLGNDYGKAFRLILTNDAGTRIGLVSGSFSGGSPHFDADSIIPSTQTSKTITLTSGQSQRVVSAGKVTDQDLRTFLGDDYGKPFRLILTNDAGNRIGLVSGSFSGGSPQFDADSIIPTSQSVTTIALTGSQSKSVISAGKVTDSVLRGFLGDNYGKGPFKLILTDDAGSRIGLISGSFSGGSPNFDADSIIPSSFPSAPSTSTPSNSPVTLTGSQSQRIISAGKVTAADLKDFLGDAYGKGSFKLILTDNNGSRIGLVSGSFSGGLPTFDADNIIPASFPSTPTASPTTIKLTSSQSQQIISAGKVTAADLRQFLGDDYGKGAFKLILTNAAGARIGLVSGSFSASGDFSFDSDNIIPTWSSESAASSTTSVTPPKPTDAPDGSNTGSITIQLGSGEQDAESFLNSLSYQYILKAANGKYGPFYVTFSSPDGMYQGYIKGTISKASYSYEWRYSY